MSEGVRLVDILVGEVDAARKGDLSVDDGDLSVRAVVLRQVEHGAEGVETHTFHALFFQLGGVVVRHFEHGADVVVDDAHVYALFALFQQYLQHGAPKVPLADDKVFEEDVLFRLFQLFDQALCVFFADVEVFRSV